MARFGVYSSGSSDEESDHDRKPIKNAYLESSGEDSSSEAGDQAMESGSSSRGKNATSDEEESDEDYEESSGESGSEEEESQEEGTDESDSDDSEAQPRSSPTKPKAAPIIPWAQKVGVDAQKMHVMQTSLFRVPEENAALKAINQPQQHLAVHQLNRKHSRDSEGDSLRIDSKKRPSFAHDVNPQPYRPSRKYARVDKTSSVVADNEGSNVDAGLARGRSFGVGWGAGGKLVHLGSICSPASSSKVSANSSIINLTTIPLAAAPQGGESTLSKLLQHHLSNTSIEMDEDGYPVAYPSSSLRFSSFATLFPLADTSRESSIFRLGHALFDDLDLDLPLGTPPDIRQRATSLRRKAALSSWLESASSSSVEVDLSKASSPLARVFALLTGNQVERACDVAMEGGYPKLATLISQSGGDLQYRDDLRSQLEIWREQSVDCHLDDDLRKVYALLAGLIDEVVAGSKGTGIEQCSDVDVLAGLDWKRVFGLCLWVLQPIDSYVADAFHSYIAILEEAEQSGRSIAAPTPPYASTSTIQWEPTASKYSDALFSLIRLYADPTCSLSQSLDPASFSPSSLDYSMCWHLYILLSRCMRVRDFGDRGDPGVRGEEDGEESDTDTEGNSQTADLLASTYAFHLEKLGLIQEAVFVLLHIEGSAGRKKAIKELLGRSAPKLDEWHNRGLLGSLKIPLEWANEARATYAISQGNYFLACELYYAAGRYTDAYDIAVSHLAPDAILRRDMDALKSLFSRFEGKYVEGWLTRGKVLLDYVQCMTRLPELLKSLHEAGRAVPDASEASELEEFSRMIPRLVSLVPEVLRDRTDPRQEAASAEMSRALLSNLDRIKPLALVNLSNISNADEASKLNHIRSRVLASFMKNVEIAAAA